MIALAKTLPTRKKSTRSTKATTSAGRPINKPLTPAEKRRRTILANKRQALFAREIEYIGGDVFYESDAERLASTPPADARVPLQRTAAEAQSAAGRSLSPYLASLYQTRLLSKDEEQFYFRRMNWLKFQALQRRDRLDPKRATMKQMKQIEGLLAEAETIKAILITSNLRLVVSIAKKFNEPSSSFDELISEGNVALMRSVEKFNFALGNRFSTYATYAIQRHFFRISHKSRQYRNRFATDDEPVRDRAEEPRDEDACTPGQVDYLRGLFEKFLGELEPREQQIVLARFGFDGDKPKTFRELGIEMGVCKERIRQIQTRAIEKLRSMAEAAQLEQTVGDWL
jgi:RNA polymerase primary sigma factor